MNRVLNFLLKVYCITLLLGISHEAKSIDFQFQPYYDDFMRIANDCKTKVNNPTLRIEMTKKINKQWIAVCSYKDNIISVNENHWFKLTENERKQTIYHELAHCLLDSRHDDTSLNIMNSKGFVQQQYFSQYYDYFIRRLFKDCKKPLYEKFEPKEIL